MTPIDVDKVKKQYDWDPSKGDYIYSAERNTKKNSSKFLYLVIAAVVIFGVIAYMKFF